MITPNADTVMLTGKDFLEYLKEKVLLRIGFSKESYTLREPGGFTVGDSGVMCTSRDLLIFARLIMKRGEWDGVQYIDRAFMEEAVKKQSHNELDGNFDSYNNRGYGYLIWKTHPDGFSLVGMGDQLAVCDTKRDLTFVITSDNQGERGARHIIYHEYYKHFIEEVSDAPLAPAPDDYAALEEYLGKRELVSQYGEAESPIAKAVSGVRYRAEKNSQGIKSFTLYLEEGREALDLEIGDRVYRLEFSKRKNKLTEFSFGQRARYDMMGVYEEGRYRTAASGAWVEDNTFAILAQVIDTYFGCLAVHISYKDERATLVISRYGQYVFEEYGGYVIGKREN